jgi:hypothetical protein
MSLADYVAAGYYDIHTFRRVLATAFRAMILGDFAYPLVETKSPTTVRFSIQQRCTLW